MFLLLTAPMLLGWVYYEHRDIAVLAIQRLYPDHRKILDGLWAEARVGHESRLSEQVADTSQGEDPKTIDFAAWAAIAGDHSCSPANMLHNILDDSWIIDVAGVCAKFKNNMIEAGSEPYKRVNALRNSDLDLQSADPEYATRAGSNNVHFLLARPEGLTEAPSYAKACLHAGAELNAMGTYTMFHVSALRKAGALSRPGLSPETRSSLALAMLADEAFALHFLEDCFAAGHVAGTWGAASVRKGTHDYYNENGLEINTWEGKNAILVGDAWMRPSDAERAAGAVRKSIEEILDASTGAVAVHPYDIGSSGTVAADTFNVCKGTVQPEQTLDSTEVSLAGFVLLKTPVPELANGLGSMPRFRAELGPFIGAIAGIQGGTIDGGFGTGQTNVGGWGGLGVGMRIGLGIEGVMNESGDGLVFLDLGIRQDGASTAKLAQSQMLDDLGSISAAIPGRSGFTTRLRMPFWLIPGDLIVAAPFLLPTTPNTYAGMAVQSANGGLIPWQSGIATPIGRFQFILGREIGVSFFGYGREDDRVILPSPDSSGGTLIGLRTIAFDFPVIEYRPFRSFSLDQSSSLVLQLSTGFDTPTRVVVIDPVGAPEPDVRTVWHIALRLAFDWRHYF